VLGSCRAPLPAARPTGTPAGGASNVTAREVLTPAGIPLKMTCTPTGPEVCFDATDNNCNGIIDEGCGRHTGPLQFAIAWPEGTDVELEVSDPSGAVVKPNDRTESGLAKDGDCGSPQSACHGQNVENVYFAGDRPPPGRYRVEIKFHKAEDVRSPVKVRFGGRIGGKTFALDVELTSPEDSKAFVFAIE